MGSPTHRHIYNNRTFDLRLNGREFESHRLFALSGSNLGQVTYTYWPSRSQFSIVLAYRYLAAGEKPPLVRLSRQL